MALARGVLWFGLIASVVFGGVYLVDPALLTGAMGIEATSAVGLTDLRASYGGFQLGMAGFLGWCLRDASRFPAGLVGFGCLAAALALCRTVGLAVDGLSAEMAAAAMLEFGLAGLTFFSLSRLESAPTPPD